MKNRSLDNFLKQKSTSKLGRIIALTGARQTGKTTLVQAGFPDYAYVSLEDPLTRPEYAVLSATQWQERYPIAILDEVQKVPSVIEPVKAAYDLYPETKYILLGSSQILLMEKVRESLAGRVALAELYPLTFPEMITSSWEDHIIDSRMVQWLRSNGNQKHIDGIPLQSEQYAVTSRLMEQYLRFGAMPAIIDDELDDENKFDWLHDYIQTYLQRDIRDLANLRELEPFVRVQKALAGLTGQCININGLARHSGVAAKTAKRFLTYLEISYQMVLLKPWFRNINKRLIKSPKIHFLDPGIQRAILGRRGQMTGAEFESAIVAEIFKQIKNSRLPIECYHLRTVDGREVDLILETEDWFVPIEIKMTDKITSTDAKHLRNLEEILDRPVLHSFIISNDPRIKKIDTKTTALPASWFLGCQ
jgi:predicted AAA+ superfamily ATPase